MKTKHIEVNYHFIIEKVILRVTTMHTNQTNVLDKISKCKRCCWRIQLRFDLTFIEFGMEGRQDHFGIFKLVLQPNHKFMDKIFHPNLKVAIHKMCGHSKVNKSLGVDAS